MDVGLQELEFLVRFFFRPPGKNGKTRHDLDRVGIPAQFRGARFDVGISAPRLVDGELRDEHHVREFGRKLASRIRTARLHQNGMALWRAVDVERAANREMLALVMKEVELFRVEICGAAAIVDKSVVIPGIP
jgi:hypothetical protein